MPRGRTCVWQVCLGLQLFGLFEDVGDERGVLFAPGDGVVAAAFAADGADDWGGALIEVGFDELRFRHGSLIRAKEDASAVVVLPEDVSGEGADAAEAVGGDMAEDEKLVKRLQRVRFSVDAVGKMGEREPILAKAELDQHTEVGVGLDALIVGIKDEVAERIEDGLFAFL